MKRAMIAIALLCMAPTVGFCQDATQTQFNVPPGLAPPDAAIYQDPAASTPPALPGQPPQSLEVDPSTLGPAEQALLSEGPGTAQEQGYDPGLVQMQERLRREAADYAAMNTARQLGLVIPAPHLYNPVSKDLASRAWIQDWVSVLSGLGIPASKVHFEANRLTREDFGMWASRMVWAYGTPAHVRQMECCAP